jgi:fumarate reductase flavoprotein subunit
LEKAISQGWAFKADTLNDCAKKFNLSNLEATVKSYNDLCDKGADTQFGKSSAFMKKIGDGPYYVFEYEPAIWCTQGGIKIDQHCRVLDVSSNAIPGLYVGGVDNGSVYCAPYYDNEGASVGMAVGCGVHASKEINTYLG